MRPDRKNLLWLILITILLSCAPSYGRQIDRAEQTWQEQGISSYRIEVLHVHSIWHAQTQVITVEDGQVVEQSASCTPAPMEFGECEVEDFDPEEYTVPGLFAQARSLAQAHPREGVQITFDETYGFPKTILFDLADVVDEDNYWKVQSFEAQED